MNKMLSQDAPLIRYTILALYKFICMYVCMYVCYRRETALQGTLVLAESGRLELRDNILLIL